MTLCRLSAVFLTVNQWQPTGLDWFLCLYVRSSQSGLRGADGLIHQYSACCPLPWIDQITCRFGLHEYGRLTCGVVGVTIAGRRHSGHSSMRWLHQHLEIPLESGPKVAMITLWNYLYVDMQFDFLIKIWMIMYVNIYDVPLFITDKLM